MRTSPFKDWTKGGNDEEIRNDNVPAAFYDKDIAVIRKDPGEQVAILLCRTHLLVLCLPHEIDLLPMLALSTRRQD